MVSFENANINLEHIAKSGQCFRWKQIEAGKYSFITKGQYFECKVDKNGVLSIHNPSIYEGFLKDYFDLSTDYSLIKELANKDDKYLQNAISNFGDIVILHQDLWEMIASFIISQRKSIPAIQSCVEQLCHNFGMKITDSQNQYSFPTPESIYSASLNDLRECGVGYRDKYLKSAAEWYLSRPTQITKESIMNICGVGEKISNCICLFGLHDLSFCPIDTWMKKIICNRYNGHYPDWIDSEFAGVYQQYAFMYERSLNRR